MKGSDIINHKNERSCKNDSHHMYSSNDWKNINRDERNLNDRDNKNSISYEKYYYGKNKRNGKKQA